MRIKEMLRFSNGPVRLSGTLRRDVLRLWEEIETGLGKVAASRVRASSVSVDSWGVDHVLKRTDEPMLTAPFRLNP